MAYRLFVTSFEILYKTLTISIILYSLTYNYYNSNTYFKLNLNELLT